MYKSMQLCISLSSVLVKKNVCHRYHLPTVCRITRSRRLAFSLVFFSIKDHTLKVATAPRQFGPVEDDGILIHHLIFLCFPVAISRVL